MKIESIQLNDFRSHEQTMLALDRINFITGANGAGKSSVAMALEYLLTGRCDATDDGGRGADDLISSSARELEVSATIQLGDNRFEMTRVRTQSSSTLELSRGKNNLTGKLAQEWITNQLPAMPILSAVLNSSRFVDMDAAAQKKLLSQVLADEGIEIPEELRWEGADTKKVTLPELDRMHKQAFERRTEVNRKLKELANLEAPAEIELPTLDSVQQRLSGLRSERDKSISARAEIVSKTQEAPKRRAALETQISHLNVLKQSHEQKIKYHRETLEERIQIEAERILSMDREKELKAIADQAPEGQSKVETVRAKLEAAMHQKNALVQLGAKPACPTCTRDLSKEETGRLLKVISGFIEELQGQLERAREADRKRELAAEAKKAIQASIASVYNKEQLEKELAAESEPDSHIAAQLQDAEKQIAALPVNVEAADTSEIDAQIAELDGRIAKGEGVMLQVNEKRRKLDSYKEMVELQARYQDELSRLEKMLAFAGPDGARKQALSGKIDAFNQAIGDALGKFGFCCAISVEPFAIQAGLADGGRRLPIHQLSESERWRFSVAFQIALAKVTGVDLVVVDRADILDKEARRQLSAMLLGSEIGQAIVCSTSTEPIPENVPAGVRFYRLEQQNGVTRISGRSHGQAVAA